jgi:hypothetical protein
MNDLTPADLAIPTPYSGLDACRSPAIGVRTRA